MPARTFVFKDGKLMATDWALEITKFVLTPILAGVGAYIGFMLSNRGKKHEILYKEKLDVFKKLSAELFKLRHMTVICLLGNEIAEDYRKYSIEEAENFLREYERKLFLLDEDPTIFLSRKTRDSFEKLRSALREALSARVAFSKDKHEGWVDIVRSFEERGRIDNIWLKSLTRYSDSLAALKDATENCINAIYVDLGLPNLTSRFERERAITKEKVTKVLIQAAETAASSMLR